MTDVMPITWAMLSEHGACIQQMVLFRKLFGSSWVPNEADARRYSQLFDIEWAVDHLLDHYGGFYEGQEKIADGYRQVRGEQRAYADALLDCGVIDRKIAPVLVDGWDEEAHKMYCIDLAVLFVRCWREQFVRTLK